jgi:hypothetical protein
MATGNSEPSPQLPNHQPVEIPSPFQEGILVKNERAPQAEMGLQDPKA